MNIDPDRIGRLAKGLLDDGKAANPDEAEEILRGYCLQIVVGADVVGEEAWQAAILSAVNSARRALHGGVQVLLGRDCECFAGWGRGVSLKRALERFGARQVEALDAAVPTLVFGRPRDVPVGKPLIYVHAAGWRAGASYSPEGPSDSAPATIATVTAAAIAVGEAFQCLRGNPLAGDRHAGISLWNPARDWMGADPDEPEIGWLPGQAWLIGLGHLGQAYAWLLGLLPYDAAAPPSFHLQDTDVIKSANRDTSLLFEDGDQGERKTRLVSGRLESLGFETSIIERELDANQRLAPGEPALALVGLDRVEPRRHLSVVGFEKVIDAGLGNGTDSYCEMQIHELSGREDSTKVWPMIAVGDAAVSLDQLPVYRDLAESSGDRCGVTELAGRSVATSFVGLVAAGFVLAAVLRQLNPGSDSGERGRSFRLIDHSLRAPSHGSYLEFSKAGDPPRFAAVSARPLGSSGPYSR